MNITVTLAEEQPALSELEACGLLQDSIDRWAKSGLRDIEFQKDFGCTYFGMVGAYKVSAYAGEDPGEPVRTFVVVAFG